MLVHLVHKVYLLLDYLKLTMLLWLADNVQRHLGENNSG